MRRAFGDMANRSGTQRNSAAVDAQAPASFEHVADDVFIIVIDLRWVRVLLRPEGDEAGSKVLLFKATLVTNLLIYLA